MWWANAIMVGAATIAPSLVLFVLAFWINLLFGNEQFLRTSGVCKNYMYRLAYYVMFLTRRDLNWESRVHFEFHLLIEFRMWTCMWFSVWTFLEFVPAWLLLHVYVLVDLLDFVIVLFQSGVLEYISFVSAWMLLYDVYVLVDVLPMF